MDLTEQYYRIAEAEQDLIDVRGVTDDTDVKAALLEAIKQLRNATRLISRELRDRESKCNLR